MAKKKVPLRELSVAIEAELNAYNQEVTDGIKKAVTQAAKECTSQLRSTSPKDTGEYAKGWRSKTQYESDSDIRVTVHNTTKPQLTHVLEYGHAKAGGGRVEGRPHIRPAEQSAEKKLVDIAKVVIREKI